MIDFLVCSKILLMPFTNSIWFDYHRSSQDGSKGHPPIDWDTNNWPESWKKIHYKNYPRLDKLELPPPSKVNRSLDETLKHRRSRRNFAERPISLQTISDLLFWACGEDHLIQKRPYLSGGGRYPVELYLVNLVASEDWPTGVYHYNFQEHKLDVLWKRNFSKEEIASMFNYPWAKQASFVIMLSTVFERTIEKYGERGYRYMLLEAGGVGQNLALVSESLELVFCPLGGINEEYFQTLLDLDDEQESVIYGLVVG